MTIEEILLLDDTEKIKQLKNGRGSDLPDIEQIKKWLDPKGHKVFDKAIRPDKLVRTNTNGVESTKPEPVGRIGLALQKLIIKRAVAFLFGNPVNIIANTQTDTQNKILEAVKQIFREVKINSHNRKIARDLFSCTEVAELWYPRPLSEQEVPKYGIEAKSKLRVKILSPLLGEKLYPYFDDYGDLVAFSREYGISKGDKKQVFFETYTNKQIFKYDISEGDPILMDGFPTASPTGRNYAEK